MFCDRVRCGDGRHIDGQLYPPMLTGGKSKLPRVLGVLEPTTAVCLYCKRPGSTVGREPNVEWF